MKREHDPQFDWDAANIGHIARHGVAPSEVEEVLCEEPGDLAYEEIDGEPRWTSVGHTDELRVLVVVWTIRGEAFRPITAFDAPATVRRDYLKLKGFTG